MFLRIRNAFGDNSWRSLWALTGFAVVAVPLLAVWGLTGLLDLTTPKAAGVVGSVGTLIAISIGGLFAVYQFRLFRHNEPHLSVTHTVTHHCVSTNYVAVAVTAELRNTSKVAVRINETLFRMQKFDQFSDEQIEELYAVTFIDQKERLVQWPTLDEMRLEWLPGEIVVEPGEAHSETFEFIVGKGYHAVVIYSMFYNPNSSNDDDERIGWHATTVYSLEKREAR